MRAAAQKSAPACERIGRAPARTRARLSPARAWGKMLAGQQGRRSFPENKRSRFSSTRRAGKELSWAPKRTPSPLQQEFPQPSPRRKQLETCCSTSALKELSRYALRGRPPDARSRWKARAVDRQETEGF